MSDFDALSRSVHLEVGKRKPSKLHKCEGCGCDVSIRKRFCGPCSDTHRQKRLAAAYQARKAQKGK